MEEKWIVSQNAENTLINVNANANTKVRLYNT